MEVACIVIGSEALVCSSVALQLSASIPPPLTLLGVVWVQQKFY